MYVIQVTYAYSQSKAIKQMGRIVYLVEAQASSHKYFLLYHVFGVKIHYQFEVRSGHFTISQNECHLFY